MNRRQPGQVLERSHGSSNHNMLDKHYTLRLHMLKLGAGKWRIHAFESGDTPSEDAAPRTSLSCLFVFFSKYKYPRAWISSLEIFHREALSHKNCIRPSQDRTVVAHPSTQWFIPQHNGYPSWQCMANCACCKVSMHPYSDVNPQTTQSANK